MLYETINLTVGEHHYPIHVGSDLLSNADLLKPYVAGRRAFLISNETVGPLFAPTLRQVLADVELDEHFLPDGEAFKTLDRVTETVEHLIARGHTRDTTIVALGGGVVGDTAGFTAAVYQRGVPFVQIPTTLLAQVDASVGGKTAVNHALGKNMIGAFYQPQAVVIDTDTLNSLPERERIAGVAEVIKHGIMADKAYFAWVEAHLENILARDPEVMSHAIARSCQIKSDIVADDEKEKGRRALLNLGHTFGHAIESALGYGEWLHGEAVGAGLVMAADLSARMKMLAPSDAFRIRSVVEKAGLPVMPPLQVVDQLRELMSRDKKASDAGLRLILVQSIGEAVVVPDVPEALIAETISAREALCGG